NSIVLGKHSGRHALRKALEELGFEVDGAALNSAFKRFKDIADKKKKVTALDLEALVSDEMRQSPSAYAIEWFEIEASSTRAPLGARGFEPFTLLTTPRMEERGAALGAADVLHVPPGRVDEVSADLLPSVGERPLVALGGGRVVDTAKAIGGAKGVPVAAMP